SNSNSNSNSLLGGLLTPPASGMRQTSPFPSSQPSQAQPTAFGSTGRRFTAQDLANRPRPPQAAAASKGKALAGAGHQSSPPLAPRRPLATAASSSRPVTPPMMRPSVYDEDAQAAEDFDDAGFFEED